VTRYCPWKDLASREDVTFGITRLPLGQGWWLPDERAIVLDDRLDHTERRTVLAHELVHVDHDDHNCAHDGPDGPRIGRRRELVADRIAATRLISIDQLADALAWSRAPEEAAAELDVTLPMLRRRLASLTAGERDLLATQIHSIESAA
jgi:Zn-dependent peptidase ImmA (M78 family)